MNQVRADSALKNPMQSSGYNINIHERIATAKVIVTDSYIPPISQQSQYLGIFPMIPAGSVPQNILPKSPFFCKDIDTESNEGTLRSVE